MFHVQNLMFDRMMFKFVLVLEVEPKKQVAMNEVQPTNFQVHDL